MVHLNMPIVARECQIPLLLKRCAFAAIAGLFLASCASKPKSIASTDAYAVQSVTVSSTSADGQFKSALENALSGQFSGEGSGLESTLNITVTNVRIGGTFTSVLYGAVNGATMNVVVRSTKTGLKLRDFKFSVTSNASDAERARSQMAGQARNELKQIFRTRVKPEVVAQERAAALAKAKKPAKTISLDPIGDLERETEAENVVTTLPAPTKPKLIPIAEASPDTKPAAAPTTEAEAAKPTPVITAPEIKPEPSVESPTATVAAEEAATEKVEPAAPAEDDEVLCVVTLENDCSG